MVDYKDTRRLNLSHNFLQNWTIFFYYAYSAIFFGALGATFYAMKKKQSSVSA
jgi:hypothetical protein